ncbi:hypothetical protein NP233_g9352 [Leucocoprinus birnbaumii]|uniref:non-specific serine/threonine protein kinase n=1 Tax=Leucocoprinus birnbaumii TaxID=56174 RepID=A0AAD5YN98_9AGAR|nr:hypothetical protein NP233_g9352 [Leucocoprinus birnbaumii]
MRVTGAGIKQAAVLVLAGLMSQPSVHQLYERLETVGKGGYGSVHKGRHIPTGNIVALKIINLDTPDDDVDDIQREITLLSQLRDAPNVTKYFGCYMDGPRVWIVMEFAQGGSVDALMKASKDGCLEDKYASVITREVLVGLSYLHKVPVIHRDMKAANILITATGKVMICDFGVSALLATTTSKRNTLTGTPYWMAPEVVQSVAAYDTKADIWSLGIMVYEMIKGSPPHSNLDRFQVMDLIPRVKPPRLSEQEGSKDLREFMGYCLKELPTERLPSDELLKTKWIKSTAKVGLGILTELIMRLKQKGPRASLAGPLDWEKEAEEAGSGDEDDDWEFETINSRNFPRHDEGSLDTESPNESQDYEQHTIRAAGSNSALPTSLRHLFGDSSAPEAESFRSLPMPVNSPPHSSTPPAMTPPPDKTIKAPAMQNGLRLRNQSAPQLPPPMPDITPNRGRVPDTKLSSSLDKAPLSTSDMDTVAMTSIQIPDLDDLPSVISRPSPLVQPSAAPKSPSSPKRPHPTRQRSQSNAEAPVPEHRFQDRDLASPAAFRFPMNPRAKNKSQAGDVPPQLPHPKPADVGASSSHQAAHSVDTISRRTAVQPLAPPSMYRARSATSVHQSHSRYGSKPPDLSDDSLLEPPKLPTWGLPERSASEASLGTPGLKDVLKIPSLSSEHHLGFTDLLPPSPSVFTSSSRNHAPSGLSSSIDYRRSPSVLRQTSDEDVLVSRSASPYTQNLVNKGDILESKVPTRPIDMSSLAPIKPLDYTSLMNNGREHLNHEMTQTIEQLAGWLAVLEGGLTSILSLPPNDVIEEEQEPTSAIEGSVHDSPSHEIPGVWR